MFLKFEKSTNLQLIYRTKNFLLIFLLILIFTEKIFKFFKNINLLLIYILIFFFAAQGAHHQEEGFGEEDSAQGPHRRALQG